MRLADNIAWEARHPVTLPRKHRVTRLIVDRLHKDSNHGGTNQVLASLSARFWLPELKSVAEWMKCNRLALSISKTNFILFHYSKVKPNQSLRIKIDDELIKQVDSTKYLGITFDSYLTWKSLNELCLKLSKSSFETIKKLINELCLKLSKTCWYLVKSEILCEQT